MQPLARRTFDARALAMGAPPLLRCANKRFVFERLPQPRSRPLTVSRWDEMPLPEQFVVGGGPEVLERSCLFDYAADPEDGERWYVNFAHEDLFCAYGGPALAQDELQVLEHPVLASLRERLVLEPEGSELRPRTVFDDRPTPMLIEGAERAARLDESLYGNRFRAADEAALAAALTVIGAPGATRLIAMEALPARAEVYGVAEVDYLLATAYTGFRAAVLTSRERGDDVEVLVHSGFWGCGAYGGDRTLMLMIQRIAAQLADVDTLVLHTLGDAHAADDAERRLARLAPETLPVAELERRIAAEGFFGGPGDGT